MRRCIPAVGKTNSFEPSCFLTENSAWNVGLKFSELLHHGRLQETWDGIVWADVAMTVRLLCS